MLRTTTCPKCGSETLSWYSRCPACGENLHRDEGEPISRSGMTLLPRSSLGKWSLGLAIVYIVLTGVCLILARVLFRSVSNPVTPNLTILIVGYSGIVGYLSGLAAFIIGLISILKSKERSILIFLVVIVCALSSVAWLYLASHI